MTADEMREYVKQLRASGCSFAEMALSNMVRIGEQFIDLWEIVEAAEEWRTCECKAHLASGDCGNCKHEDRLIDLLVKLQIKGGLM